MRDTLGLKLGPHRMECEGLWKDWRYEAQRKKNPCRREEDSRWLQYYAPVNRIPSPLPPTTTMWKCQGIWKTTKLLHNQVKSNSNNVNCKTLWVQEILTAFVPVAESTKQRSTAITTIYFSSQSFEDGQNSAKWITGKFKTWHIYDTIWLQACLQYGHRRGSLTVPCPNNNTTFSGGNQ